MAVVTDAIVYALRVRKDSGDTFLKRSSERLGTGLAGVNANHLLDRADEDLAIADLADSVTLQPIGRVVQPQPWRVPLSPSKKPNRHHPSKP